MHTLFSAVRFSADAASRRQGRSTAARSLVLSSSTSLLSRAMAGGHRGVGGRGWIAAGPLQGGALRFRRRTETGCPAASQPVQQREGRTRCNAAPNQTASCTSAACAGGDRRRLPLGCRPRLWRALLLCHAKIAALSAQHAHASLTLPCPPAALEPHSLPGACSHPAATAEVVT